LLVGGHFKSKFNVKFKFNVTQNTLEGIEFEIEIEFNPEIIHPHSIPAIKSSPYILFPLHVYV